LTRRSPRHSPARARDFEAALKRALERGTTEHYVDAALYDHEYGRRRDDVRWYRRLAGEVGGPILELGCGSGRLMAPLIRDGHEVVGVDASRPMLARLRARLDRLAPPARARAQVIHADFRALELGRRFPLVICPFNAFQHLYDRHDVERFLAGVRAHLHPSGRFAFDLMHPDLAWLSRDPTRRWARTRFRHPTTGERMVYSTTLVYDAALQIAFMRIFYEPEARGRARRSAKIVELAHRHFFPQELEALLHYNGFSIERCDGDFAGAPLEPESEQQIYRCRISTRK
jgi:SAM-dependent methyltransferase